MSTTNTDSIAGSNSAQPGLAQTTYVVLERDQDGLWGVVTEKEARSGDAAIRAAVSAAGTYVAIPARSFRPVTVTPKTTTVLEIEEAK